MQDEAYYKQQFFTEARELLDGVSDALLQLEAAPAGNDFLQAVFRNIHTIKGSAGAFSLNAVSAFAHYVENALNKACSGVLAVTPELVDLLFQAVDMLNTLLDAAQNGTPEPDYQGLAEQFQTFEAEAATETHAAETAWKTMPLSAQAMPDGLRAILRAKAAQGFTPYLLKLHFETDMLENGYDPLVLLKNLREVSTTWYVSTEADLPDFADFQPLRLYLEVTVFLASSRSAQELQEFAFDPDLLEIIVLTVDGDISDAVDTQCLKDFLEEDTLLVEQIEQLALTFETRRDAESLNALFRAVHTLKGDASYAGLKSLGAFAHHLEAFLDKIRTNPTLGTSSAVDVILSGVDKIKKALQTLARGEVNPELGTIAPLAPAEETISPRDQKEVLAPEVSSVFIAQLVQHKKVLEQLCGVDLPASSEVGQRVRRVAKGLTSASRFIGLPELARLAQNMLDSLESQDAVAYGSAYTTLLAWIDEITGEPRKIGEILQETGQVTPQDVQNALHQQKPLGEILVEEGKLDPELLQHALKKQTLMQAASRQQEAQQSEQPQTLGTAEIRVMRVDEEKIDSLANMIGELVVAKNVYDYLINSLMVNYDLPGTVIKSFKDNVYLFSRITAALQQSVLSVRMIPIRGVFHKYSRVVRDIARKQGKLIDFITEGEDTEVDKKVADTLSEPLIHMVRNACDHGIETPEERRAAGKAEKGTVRLKAWQKGSRLYVRVSDDGKGMNRRSVFEKALERGLPVTSLEDERLLDVIFLPGFSMKEEVTDISGRGVGMDAVRASVTSLGGSVSFSSEEGQGSVFTLELPMTMGISTALVVEAAGRQYAIPLDNVLETIKITPDKIRTIQDRKGVYYRGEVLPVERLDTLLYERSHSGDPQELFQEREERMLALFNPEEEIAIVVLGTQRGKYGVVVDGLNRNVEISIRPVPDALKDIAVISGVSILGDGKILLVLNPEHLA